MLVRRLWVVLLVLLFPATASADDHKAGLFGGGGAEAGSVLGFGRITFGRTLSPELENWSLVGDFTFSNGSHGDLDLSRRTVMGGVRWMRPQGDDEQHVLGLHALVGVVNAGVDNGPTNDERRRLGDGTKAAVAVGVSWDYVINRADDDSGWAVRTQADYVLRFDAAEDFFRVSAGLGYRWGWSQ